MTIFVVVLFIIAKESAERRRGAGEAAALYIEPCKSIVLAEKISSDL